MRAEPTAAEIAAYRKDGFVVLHDFLNPDELDRWRTAVDEAVTGRGRRKTPDKDWEEGDSYYDKVFIQRLNLWQDSPGVRNLLLDERIGKLACDLSGLDGIRIWHDQALIKAPWANPTSWHLDTPYWSFSHREALSIWIALDDATLENGCLFFLPGTKDSARFDNASIGNDMSSLFKLYPEWKKVHSVAAPMKAGSCSFHNGLTAHGAHANMTAGWRRAMTCAFMPDGATFNGQSNILPPAMVQRLKTGDPLDDPTQNPLLWHRTGSHRPNLDRLRGIPGPVSAA